MADLSPGALYKYLKHPFHCPFCESENIDADTIEPEHDGSAYCEVTCLDCDSSWVDAYRLAAIEHAVDRRSKTAEVNTEGKLSAGSLPTLPVDDFSLPTEKQEDDL